MIVLVVSAKLGLLPGWFVLAFIIKEAPTKYLFLADSQARFLEAGNLNILSLPGASIRHLYDYIPPAGRFEIIILFDGFEP